MSTAIITETKVPQFINGQWTDSAATEWQDVVNPATGEILAKVPLASSDEVTRAVDAAASAYPEWRRTPPEDRIQPLFKLKMLLEEHLDDFGRIITQENGKTFAEAKAEMRRAIENVEVACGIPMMMQGYNLEDVARGIDEIMSAQSCESTPPAPGWIVTMALRISFSPESSVSVSRRSSSPCNAAISRSRSPSTFSPSRPNSKYASISPSRRVKSASVETRPSSRFFSRITC